MEVRGFFLRVLKFPDCRRLGSLAAHALEEGVEVFRSVDRVRFSGGIGECQEESRVEDRFGEVPDQPE